MTTGNAQPIDRYFPLGPDFYQNPYVFYDRLRTEDPIHWSDLFGGWVLSRYADVANCARDPRISARRMGGLMDLLPPDKRDSMREFEKVKSREMNMLDPPDHTRIRGLVNKAFSPRMVDGMRGRIQAIVDDLLNAVIARGHLDVIRELAFPLPATVIMEIIGIPVEDRDLLKKWSDDQVKYTGSGRPTPELADAYRKSQFAIMDYYKGLIAIRKKAPRDDLLSSLIAAEESGEVLSEDELMSACVFLAVAGHETTTNLIGNGLLALVRHPDQHALLRENPSLAASTIEEMLRYDAPVQRPARIAAENFNWDGREVKKGQLLWQLLGSANRDPAAFDAPNTFDITRQNNRHVTFNVGIHFCLGAPLARLEGQVAIETLVHRMPKLRLASDQADWNPNMHFRGLRTLNVEF